MTTHSLTEELSIVLADSFALYLKTLNYHWNVSCPNFYSLHLLFESQYTELQGAIDVIAERIRSIGGKAPGGFRAFGKLSTLDDADVDAAADQMVSDLCGDQQKIVRSLGSALEEAKKAEDDATADLLIQRIAVHEKNAWMLRETLGEKASGSPRKVA